MDVRLTYMYDKAARRSIALDRHMAESPQVGDLVRVGGVMLRVDSRSWSSDLRRVDLWLVESGADLQREERESMLTIAREHGWRTKP